MAEDKSTGYIGEKVKKGVDNPLTVWYKRYVDSDKDITI